MKVVAYNSWKDGEKEHGYKSFYILPIIAYAKDKNANGVYMGWLNYFLFITLKK